MDIIIGKPLEIRLLEQNSKKKSSSKAGEVKANIIGFRSSRRSPVVLNKGLHDRRSKRIFKDPDTSKVVTLLIENGDVLPEDIDKGEYTVTLKFTKE